MTARPGWHPARRAGGAEHEGQNGMPQEGHGMIADNRRLHRAAGEGHIEEGAA